MGILSCTHCGGSIEKDDQSCANCGIPLPPNHASQKQRRFIIWFIALVFFCLFMIFWLPPDWPALAKR